MVEFCWKHISHAWHLERHNHFNHNHPNVCSRSRARETSEKVVNRILSRNGLGYVLNEKGRVERIGPTILGQELASIHFQSGDAELDRILETARVKFLGYRQETRREALLELWDAWERLKTTGQGSKKEDQISFLLDVAAGSASPKISKTA